MFRPFFIFFLSGFFFLTAGCAGQKVTPAPDHLPASHWFEMKIDKKDIRIQLVVTQEEMQRGLMHRTELSADDGMIFPYTRPRKVVFWMKNTPLPLDIGYFDSAGILREIYQLHPFDETSVPSRSSEIQFALEMNQGWFSRNKIRPGAALDLDLLAARGFEPSDYGL